MIEDIEKVQIEISNFCPYAPMHPKCPAHLVEDPAFLDSRVVMVLLKFLREHSIQGAVSPDGHIGTVEVIINGAGESYHLQGLGVVIRLPARARGFIKKRRMFGPFRSEYLGPGERSITADNDQCLDVVFLQVGDCLPPSLLRSEPLWW